MAYALDERLQAEGEAELVRALAADLARSAVPERPPATEPDHSGGLVLAAAGTRPAAELADGDNDLRGFHGTLHMVIGRGSGLSILVGHPTSDPRRRTTGQAARTRREAPDLSRSSGTVLGLN